MNIIELFLFMGIPVELIWLAILIGIAIGIAIPLKPIIRKKLHFSIEKDLMISGQRDYEALEKQLPSSSEEEIIKFSKLLRNLGLTLFIEK